MEDVEGDANDFTSLAQDEQPSIPDNLSPGITDFLRQCFKKVLNALFNLCKINKRRQEQAAENGIIPHLMHFVISGSPLKRYTLPLLCDMAHASRNSRELLSAHGRLDVYLRLLDDNIWSVTTLDCIAICLAHDNDKNKVEQALLRKDAVPKLVKFFRAVYEHHPHPKQLIVENDFQKLHNLIEERRDGQSSGGQVLVKQMATSLLKALHINIIF